MEASGQIRLFIMIMIAGITMGIVFDFYRVVRKILRLKMIMTSLFDLLYWLLATVVVFGVLLAGNWGEVRSYVFIALVTGAGLYYRFFSRCTMHLMIRTIRTLFIVIGYLRLILLTLLTPFKYIAGLISKPFVFVGRRTRQYYKTYRLKR